MTVLVVESIVKNVQVIWDKVGPVGKLFRRQRLDRQRVDRMRQKIGDVGCSTRWWRSSRESPEKASDTISREKCPAPPAAPAWPACSALSSWISSAAGARSARRAAQRRRRCRSRFLGQVARDRRHLPTADSMNSPMPPQTLKLTQVSVVKVRRDVPVGDAHREERDPGPGQPRPDRVGQREVLQQGGDQVLAEDEPADREDGRTASRAPWASI